MSIRNTSGMEKLGTVLVTMFLGAVLVVTFFPFWNILVLSLNDANDSMRGGLMLFPRVLSLESYKAVFASETILPAVRTTLLRTIIGTPLSVIVIAMLSYGLSKKTLPGRRFITLYFILTMYFGEMLISKFMVVKALNLYDNFWVMILPEIVNIFWVVLVRTYMEGLPGELEESAKIDGANDVTIFVKIILPLCLPIITTIALFAIIKHWSAWYDSYIYTTKAALTTLAAELVRILNQFQTGAMMSSAQQLAQDSKKVPVSSESIRMAVTMVTTIPIVMIYPFMQKYFVKGMFVGAVKG